MELTAISIAILHRYVENSGPQDFSATLPEHEVKLLVSTSVFLASKLEECPRRLRDVINVTHRLTWQRSVSKPRASPTMLASSPLRGHDSAEGMGGGVQGAGATADIEDDGGTLCLDHEYLLLKERVVAMEQKVLRALAFDLEMAHPFRYLLHFARFLQWPLTSPVYFLAEQGGGGDGVMVVLEYAWVLCVDSLWSPACCLDTRPAVLAAAALYIATAPPQPPAADVSCRTVSMPEETRRMQRIPWWQALGVQDEEIAIACERLLFAAADASTATTRNGVSSTREVEWSSGTGSKK